MDLNQEQKEVLIKLKESTGIGDDNTAILRLVEYDWNLERAIENNSGTILQEDVIPPPQNRRPRDCEQKDGDEDVLLDPNSTDESNGNEEIEMTVNGDERLSFRPKYNWDSADTKNWKVFVRKRLKDQCAAITYDYQKFNKLQFSQVEEMIAINIHGYDERIAIQALKTNNLLCSYSAEQRKQVMEVRIAIEEIAGDEILIQVVPLLIRRDEDIEAKKFDSFVVSVFRVKAKDPTTPDLFVDWNATIHETWENVIDGCPGLPQGMMAYPKNGFLREQNKSLLQEENSSFRVCDISFGETPKSGFFERNLYVIKTGMMVVTAASTLAMAWNPLGWTGIAFGAARGGLALASLMLAVTNGNAEDARDLSLSLPAFIKNIGNILIKDGIHHYLRTVAKQHRGLTALERIIINVFGDGFNEEQILSFVCCVYSIAMDMRNRPKELSVMRLVKSSQELFSSILAPKKAERMLEDVRAELGVEELEKICLLQERKEQLQEEFAYLAALDVEDHQLQAKENELKQCDAELLESQRIFQAMKSKQLEQTFLKMKKEMELQEEVERLEAQLGGINYVQTLRNKEKIRQKKEEIDRIRTDITKLQLDHLQQFMEEDMMDTSAKEAFKQQVILRCSQRQSVEENHRIIQAIFEMDAEVLFKFAADTQSTISFPTGERLTVRINDQIDISPNSVSKMSGLSEAEQKEFGDVMKTAADFRDGLLTEDELIEKVNKSMLAHEKITNTEKNQFITWITTSLPAEDSSFVATLSQRQRRLLKNSLSSVSQEDQTLLLRAALLLARGLKLSISNRLADCVDLTITFVQTKIDQFFNLNSELESDGRVNHNAVEILGLPEEKLTILQLENFPASKMFTTLLDEMAQPGTLSSLHIATCKEKMPELLHTCPLPSETLSFNNRQKSSTASIAETPFEAPPAVTGDDESLDFYIKP